MKSVVLITFVRRLFHIRRTQRSFESPRYLLKWLLISTLIGLVAGIGAIAFYAAIHFVIVGMMALFGGIAHAPLAVMLMVAEMTGNLSLLAPAMIAVGISVIIVGETTIYTSQVDTRADSPAHRLQLSFPLLSTLAVRQSMMQISLRFLPQQTVAEAEAMLAGRVESGAPVLGERN